MVIQRLERSCLLTLNGGSSSLKFAVFPLDLPDPIRPLIAGRIQRIGLPDAQAVITDPAGGASESMAVDTPDLPAASGWLIDWLEPHVGWPAIAGVAHRIVHGGAQYFRPGASSRRKCWRNCAGSPRWIRTTSPARSR